MLCLLCISYVFYCFFVFFIYVFICSYSIFHCSTVFLSIFYRLLMTLYFSFLQHQLTFFHIFQMNSLILFFKQFSAHLYVHIEQYRFLYSRNVLHFAISGARMSYRAVFPALAFLSKEAF